MKFCQNVAAVRVFWLPEYFDAHATHTYSEYVVLKRVCLSVCLSYLHTGASWLFAYCALEIFLLTNRIEIAENNIQYPMQDY